MTKYIRVSSVRDDEQDASIRIVTVSHADQQRVYGRRRAAMVNWVLARIAEEGWYDMTGYVCQRMDTCGTETVLFFQV